MVSRYRLCQSIFFSIFLSVCTLEANAQEVEEDKDDTYDSEFTYGVNWNTNGGLIGGFSLKYATFRKPGVYNLFCFEAVNVKGPKEIAIITNPDTGTSYTGNKQNYLFSLRLSYGREIVLFQKAQEEGVRISFIGAAGPTIGIVKPYYVLFGSNYFDAQPLAYDPRMPSDHIYGSGGFFYGFDQSNVKLGLHAKSSLNFEFGTFNDNVTGVELGFMLEAFPKEILIMANNANNSFFSSVFITLYFGLRR